MIKRGGKYGEGTDLTDKRMYSFLLTNNQTNGDVTALSGRGFYSGYEILRIFDSIGLGQFNEVTFKMWAEGEEDEELDD